MTKDNINQESWEKKFIRIFDHIIWYIIGIIIILSLTYISAHESKRIYLTGNLICSDLEKD